MLKIPSLFVVVGVSIFVSTFVAVTFAFGTTAPVGSVTVPFTLPVIVCASNAMPQQSSNATKITRILWICRFIVVASENYFVGLVKSPNVLMSSMRQTQKLMQEPSVLRRITCLGIHTSS